jgi:hypothetical protein
MAARGHLVGLPSALPPDGGESLEDRAREQRILDLTARYNRMAAFGAVSRQLVAVWEDIKREVNARSPAQVRRMEKARGLAR